MLQSGSHLGSLRDSSPSNSRDANNTTASLIPLSEQTLFLFITSFTSSLSRNLSIFSFSSGPISSSAMSGVPSSVAAPNSYRRKTRTKTLGTSSRCLRIQIGAMSPSGYSGDVGVKGEMGECAPLCPFCRRALRGGKRTFFNETWQARYQPTERCQVPVSDAFDVPSPPE